jgi:hypothetical protein
MGQTRGDLKLLFSAEAGPGGLARWRPPDPDAFAVYVQAFIGEEGEERFDSFDILVCTPPWLADNWDHPLVGRYGLTSEVKSGRNLVLMLRWDYSKLLDAIAALCRETSGPSWPEVANRIGRLLPWEYDYRYDEDKDKPPSN